MFFRLKASGPRSYLQIVESRRDGARVQQHVIATIGRADELVVTLGGPNAITRAEGRMHLTRALRKEQKTLEITRQIEMLLREVFPSISAIPSF